MSTTTTSSRTPSVQWLIESRPPGLTWSRPSPSQPNQPPLDLTDHEPDVAEVAAPNDRGVRVSMVKARWSAKQRPGLPDAGEWSTTLALALTQSLLGQRSVAQLNRWVVDDVLVAIGVYQRAAWRCMARRFSYCSAFSPGPAPRSGGR